MCLGLVTALSWRPQQRHDFIGLRKPARRLLREDSAPVDGDLEDSATALDEHRRDADCLLDPGRQTGGPGQVVSLHAVGDRDLQRLHAPMVHVGWPCCNHAEPVAGPDSTADHGNLCVDLEVLHAVGGR